MKVIITFNVRTNCGESVTDMIKRVVEKLASSASTIVIVDKIEILPKEYD